jgi:5'-3' exonuclease
LTIFPCLIDGTYELFRAFYGAPSRLSPGGQEVAATLALGRSLLGLARSGQFTHFAVAFDTVIESFRNDLFAGYKTGEGIDPALHAQFPLAERVTQALGFRVLSMIEFEADDGLASAARLFRSLPEVSKVTIASPDKDLMQLVDEKVVTWDRLREKEYDRSAVLAKFGVEPESIPDYLALVGDTADGILGVPRWGARSAGLILAHYRHLEHIPPDESQWQVRVRGAAALAQSLRDHQQEVMLYRKLATLRDDVDLGLSVSDLAYQGVWAEELSRLEAELGLKFAR